ncbi:Uncharacterised protein [Mycobacterium tuberculosis]|uniref:Uncharacterized protein n=1 Tax=Mycobacterium tuberculosis TaxID=1773 RepID=A0A0T7PTF6_MYCTX|nr:Uncharacterised protein [Mycobacterium tuberculosis]COV94670.1 Uncharacterised protein [Mycobacterium tuberculosis]COW80336.1 Uncharacterised protein [Mycobacterium tuberculosis]COW95554.1 Uncharacterised protein [Mycobacterium tuberculosis]COX55802.1 Uncharacterised protein [Mycobacterium tuberculosis]
MSLSQSSFRPLSAFVMNSHTSPRMPLMMSATSEMMSAMAAATNSANLASNLRS